jgi:hypothetical protein
MLAKKKANSKVGKAAEKALAALEALEFEAPPPDNGMVPVAPETRKTPNKEAKKAKNADASTATDPFAVAFPEGMAPVKPEAVQKTGRQQGAGGAAVAPPKGPPAPAASPAPKTLTMAMPQLRWRKPT